MAHITSCINPCLSLLYARLISYSLLLRLLNTLGPASQMNKYWTLMYLKCYRVPFLVEDMLDYWSSMQR